MKIAFFRYEDWEKQSIEAHEDLKALGAETIFFEKPLTPADAVPEEARDAEVISVFVDSAMPKEIIDTFPHLKHIATRSTGFDHIDLAYCNEKGITVSNVPSYGERTVAEQAFALLLTISRRVIEAYGQLRETGDFSQRPLRGFDLFGKTIGIVGTGKIGKNSARIARGFGMKVLGYDVYRDESFAHEIGMHYMELPELVHQSDIVTIHVPYMKATHHLVNKELFSHFKKGSVLINTSRGAVVDTEALIQALDNETLAYAGLDVLEEEEAFREEEHLLATGAMTEAQAKTVLANHALIDMPNVVVTPHNAFNTWEALGRILLTTIENIVGFANGSPVNVVKKK